MSGAVGDALRASLRCRRLVTLIAALSALLSVAPPAAHAQDAQPWGGRVEVDTNGDGVDDGGGSLVVDGGGGSIHYRIRLSEQPTDGNGDPVDGYWIVLRVDGGMRPDGDYNGITWVPSVGWEFTKDNWDQWRGITIHGGGRETAYNGQPITIEHEVWDHETNCPFKGSPLTVQVVDRPPALTIPDATVAEDDAARLVVELSKASSQTVTVRCATPRRTAARRPVGTTPPNRARSSSRRVRGRPRSRWRPPTTPTRSRRRASRSG